MNIPGIMEVKEHLDLLKREGLIADWELPYENILTRRSAAIFFIDPIPESNEFRIELNKYDNFSMRLNDEKKLSQMSYRITFSKEEKDRNAKLLEVD